MNDPKSPSEMAVRRQAWLEDAERLAEADVDPREAVEVEEAETEMADDSLDGDAESALASAGFGTDEDYGCFANDGE